MGASCLQGGHQVDPKSTRTGIGEAITSAAKLASVSSGMAAIVRLLGRDPEVASDHPLATPSMAGAFMRGHPASALHQPQHLHELLDGLGGATEGFLLVGAELDLEDAVEALAAQLARH